LPEHLFSPTPSRIGTHLVLGNLACALRWKKTVATEGVSKSTGLRHATAGRCVLSRREFQIILFGAESPTPKGTSDPTTSGKAGFHSADRPFDIDGRSRSYCP
jgi:hypothetical protein